MKVLLEFMLPEEAQESRHAQNGVRYFRVLRDVDELLRSKLKHTTLTASTRSNLEEIRSMLREENILMEESA